jgi:subtilisin-like proprotein convertase family protein
MRFFLLLIGFIILQTSLAAQTCSAPTLLSVVAVSDSSVALTWTDVGTQYELELRPVSATFSGVPTHVVPSDPPFLVQQLVPGENYRVRVRNVCAGGNNSGWSTARNFATDLNNARPCPLDFTLRDTSCLNSPQLFNIVVDDAPGQILGTDVRLKAVRLALEHPWRSDLQIDLIAPDQTRIRLVSGLNAGDQNLGQPLAGACSAYMELSDDASALPLSAAAEQDNPSGQWRAVEAIAAANNGQAANGTWQLSVCDSKAAHTGKLRLLHLVFESLNCAAPTGLNASAVQLNSATLGWSAVSVSGDSVEVVYGPTGTIPETGGTLLRVPASEGASVLVQNLIPLRDYVFFVRQRCLPAQQWGAYSTGLHFFSGCPATLTESFDTLTVCAADCTTPCPLPGIWQNVPNDDFEWKVRTGPGITFPVAGPPAPAGGSGNYLFFRNSCSPSGANAKRAILRSTCVLVEAPAGPPCHFSFDLYMNTKLGQMSTLQLQASTNGGLNWQTVQTWSGNRGKQWRREFVNLSSYHQQVTVFQWVATGVFGAYGDIALDNLTFYGAVSAGTPNFTFYRDQDGDGFGAANQPFVACSPNTPAGYVNNATDCNDNAPSIRPNAPELLCNGTDENCNGAADDSFIPLPVVQAPAPVCAGQSAQWSIAAAAKGQYFWFDANDGAMLGTGNSLILNHLNQNRTIFITDSIVAGGCHSGRITSAVTVRAKPDLQLPQALSACANSAFNFNTAGVFDDSGLSGALSFHTAFPPTVGNQVPNGTVTPLVNSNFWAFKTALNGCADTLLLPLAVQPNPSVQLANGDSLTLCKGRSVSLSATVSGGNNVQFSWSNGLNFNPVNWVAAQVGLTQLTVTVTDQNGCTGTDRIQLRTLPSITQTNIGTLQNVTTCGGTDGSITLQPVDGQAPYQFAWAGGSASGSGSTTLGGLTQGGYRITITDASGSGCSMVLPTLVLNAPGLTVGQPVLTQPVCAGATGAISLTVVGTNPVYNWSNSGTTPAITNLPPGAYTVTVTDGNCQQVIPNLSISAPPPVEVLNNGVRQISCFGGSDGRIDMVAVGGTAPYSFEWNDGITTPLRDNLPVGSYRVTVRDAVGCSVISPTYVINDPAPLGVLTVVTPVYCFGQSDGQIELEIFGGTAPYQTAWSHTAKPGTVQAQLSAGTYTATVTDSKGCTAINTVQLDAPPPVLYALDVQQPTCAGKANGSITVTPLSGAAPFQYNWSSGASTAQLNNLSTGLFALALSDANGCQGAGTTVAINAAQLLQLQVDTLRNIPCRGLETGIIATTLSGAEGAVSISWNEITANSTDRYNLDAGQYRLRIEDQRGCVRTDTFNITEPAQTLTPALVSVTNLPCAENPTGKIVTTVQGGTAPYQLQWNNGATTATIDNLLAGNYSLLVQDANLCTAGLPSIAVTAPMPVTLQAIVDDIPCIGNPFGTITALPSGGLPPYAYQWSNGAVSNQNFDLAAGQYQLTIFDANNCAYSFDQLIVRDLRTDFQVQLLENTPVSCNGGNDGRLSVRVSNGTGPYQYAWSAPVGLHPNISADTDAAIDLSGGLYRVTVTDALGCFRAAGPFTLEESPPVAIQIGTVTNPVCKGNATGQIVGVVTGGVPAYQWVWSQGDTTGTADQLPAGTYSLTATDFRGCTAVSPAVEITEPAVGLGAVTDTLLPDACSQGRGRINTTAIGGLAPYQFQWSTGGALSDIAQLSTGTYTLTITDDQGCTFTNSWFIGGGPPALNIGNFSLQNDRCFGDSSGSIVPMVAGGTGPYQYIWSTGSTEPALYQLTGGQYRLTITDAAQCTLATEFPDLLGPTAPLQSAWSVAPAPDGWMATLLVTGGLSPYQVQWDASTGFQTGLVAMGLATGWYTATITDALGCTRTQQVVCGVSGTADAPVPTAFTIMPNPSSGIFWIKWTTPPQFPPFVQVRRADGQLIALAGQKAFASDGTLSLDLSDLPAGWYWVALDGVGKRVFLMTNF